MARKFLTTHQVAELLGVSLPTVVNWANAGLLAVHRTPGGHRRIDPEELRRFCLGQGMPLPTELAEEQGSSGPVAVLLDSERDYAETVGEFLQMHRKIEVLVVDTSFELGLAIGSRRPQVVLLDGGMAGVDVGHVIAGLQGLGDGGTTRVVVTLPVFDPSAERQLLALGVTAVAVKPVSLDALTALLLDP